MTHPVIECIKVTKEFPLGQGRAYAALRGVDLEVKPGEFVVLYGPSGSGKSTLLHLVAGLERPTSGTIKIRGEDLSQFQAKELATHHRMKIGMVFQQFNLIPTLSAVENVALPQVIAGKPLQSRLARALHLLEIFGLAHYANNLPTELSGGEQQRVAIARALVNNPWILLIDEPTGNLDTKTGKEVAQLIGNLNTHSKRTILLVTHSEMFFEFAHRIVYLLDGKSVKQEIRREYVGRVRQIDKRYSSLTPQSWEEDK